MQFLDCTLRDGGYHNAWDFSPDLVNAYLESMQAAGVNIVELGLRSFTNTVFKGACAYTTDEFLRDLPIPATLTVGVMVNASELVGGVSIGKKLERLFPEVADSSPVDLVRIACHVNEFSKALPASIWLKEKGYQVGFNLMQIADRTKDEVLNLAHEASKYPLDVLYFADSMGSMNPSDTTRIINWLRTYWRGALGVHTHDNMGLALQNTLRALDQGVTWVDSTVTGMGRGPGNARTEELAIELSERREEKINIVPVMASIRRYFKPMQKHYGWGTNPYYYLAGKYGIHPSYIQEMMSDSRYDEEDILAVIDHLKLEGGGKFSLNTLDAARNFDQGEAKGSWKPAEILKGREVLLLGSGPGVSKYRPALVKYIRNNKPVVVALNTQTAIDANLIDLRVACHPIRLLADCDAHARLPQPLITPISMLRTEVRQALADKTLYDFGLSVEPNSFSFGPAHCTLPTYLVVAYALAISASGDASRVLMAGFDGYNADDPRNNEMNKLLKLYQSRPDAAPLIAVTPTRYELESKSIYAVII